MRVPGLQVRFLTFLSFFFYRVLLLRWSVFYTGHDCRPQPVVAPARAYIDHALPHVVARSSSLTLKSRARVAFRAACGHAQAARR